MRLVRVPWRPVLAIAGVHFAALVAVAARYGYHRDELYFLEAGRHLDWGYVDQPPFTPFVARVAEELVEGSVVALRVAPALATSTAVVVAALIAREMGGDRRAQVVAAGAVAGGGFVLGVGHLLGTAAFDLLAWLALLLIVTRMLRTADPKWWLAYGGVAGLALWNKTLVPMLTVAVLVGLGVDRRWELLRTWWLPVGGLAAAVVALPTLAWQVSNDFPQVEMAEAIADRIGGENRALLLPLQLIFLGPVLVPLLIVGIRRLRRHQVLSRFRPLLWAWVAALVLTFVTAGRPYYPMALTTVVALASVVVVRWSNRMLVLNAVTVAVLALPVLPVAWLDDFPPASVNETLAETVGWQDMVDQVAAVVDELPADEVESAVILTLTYGEAGALDRYGPERGLPEVYSAHNGYWDFRRPTDDAATVVTVRLPRELLDDHFASCEQVGVVTNRHGIENEVAGTPLHVCRDLRGTWSEHWPDMRRLS